MNKSILLHKTYFFLHETEEEYLLYLLVPIIEGTAKVEFSKLNIKNSDPKSSWNVTCLILLGDSSDVNVDEELSLKRLLANPENSLAPQEEIIKFAKKRFTFKKKDTDGKIINKKELIIHTVFEEIKFKEYENYAIPLEKEEEHNFKEFDISDSLAIEELLETHVKDEIAYNCPYLHLASSPFIDNENWGAITLYPKVLLPLNKKYTLDNENSTTKVSTGGEKMKVSINLKSGEGAGGINMFDPRELMLNKTTLHDKGKINAEITIDVKVDGNNYSKKLNQGATHPVPDGVRPPPDDGSSLTTFIDKWK